MFRRSTLAVAYGAALLLAACTIDQAQPDDAAATQSTTQSADSGNTTATVNSVVLGEAPELKEPHSVDEVAAVGAIDIALGGDTATTSEQTGVTIEGNTVTITAAGTYRLSGTLAGQVVVNTTEKVGLVLDGAHITATTGAAISIVEADEVTILLAEGSTNSLEDAAGNDSSAALDSSADLSITGTGTLTAVGTTNDAISSSDGLVIESGTIIATAADDAIRGKDYLVITGGTVTATAQSGHALKSDNTDDSTVGYVSITGGTIVTESLEDGINAQSILISDGEIEIAAGDDGAHADIYMGISGGTVDITESEEGLEAAAMELAGGVISIVSADDGINGSADTGTDTMAADTSIWVSLSGAEVTMHVGGDGLDSNGNAYMSAGSLVISGPTNSGNGSIDVNGTFEISGGELAAAGSSGMAQTPAASSSQSFVQASASGSAGSTVEVQDSSGATVASFTVTTAFQNVVVSNPQIVTGETYTFVVDGAESASGTAGQESGGMGGRAGGGDAPGGGQGGGPGGRG